MAKQPQKQPGTGLPPLLPLEYCRLGRAASLLGCEEGDLIHWGSINAISLYVLFSSHSSALGSGICLIHDNQWMNRRDDMSGYGRSMDIALNDRAGYRLISAVEYSTRDCVGWLNGFWRVWPPRLKIMELTPDAQEPFYVAARDCKNEVVVAGVGHKYATRGVYFNAVTSALGLEEAEKNPPMVELAAHDLWVFRKDLELVHQHIHSGKPLPIDTDNAEQAATTEMAAAAAGESQPHPTAEYHASTRERVLVAALHARSRWPDECVTYIAWANALWDHSNELFGGNDAPLSRESIQRLLSAAEGRNEVYKRS